ncbi:hypothetical protein [Glaciecola sp. KUL10]|uniref:hypothetical protein n=1 Tax=Glaciecola sp. (strain KUL10) TaxID=2161813 RepID=UPI000D78A772|nr:hypothetical protein [Glaciecola sp. KUL10]GBL04066.1 hypothetical protein KUL10_13710 [Glaciecola sp. KUL10]
MFIRYLRLCLVLSSLSIFTAQLDAQNHEFSGISRFSLINTNADKSFLNEGTDIVRHDRNGFSLTQAALAIESDWGNGISSEITTFFHDDGDLSLGLSEVFIKYKPLQRAKKKWQLRLGSFYPELSFENNHTAWLSSDTYQFSAINAWVAEEMRINGVELSYSQNGRSIRSPYSWDIRGGLFKGNDTFGSYLTWRGFAVHDRQTLFNETVRFAPYPEVLNRQTIWSPNDVQPFREIDGRWGVYIGAHLAYLRRAELRYYFYDNRADPDKLTPERYYAWHTIFHSLSLNYQLTESTNLKMQLMDGSTLMGYRVVYADFSAAHIQVKTQISNRIKLTARAETFDVFENDNMPLDNNHSNGVSMTVNSQYEIDEHKSVGLEYSFVKNYAYNRPSLSLSPKAVVRQWQLTLELRF